MISNLPPGVTDSMIEEQCIVRCPECDAAIPDDDCKYYSSDANYETNTNPQEVWVYTCWKCGYGWAD